MRKKLFAILMSAMMMVTFMPAMAFADSTDGWAPDYSYYTVNGQKVYSTRSLVTTSGDAMVAVDAEHAWKGVVKAEVNVASKVQGATNPASVYFYDLTCAKAAEIVNANIGSGANVGDLAFDQIKYDTYKDLFKGLENKSEVEVKVSFTKPSYITGTQSDTGAVFLNDILGVDKNKVEMKTPYFDEAKKFENQTFELGFSTAKVTNTAGTIPAKSLTVLKTDVTQNDAKYTLEGARANEPTKVDYDGAAHAVTQKELAGVTTSAFKYTKSNGELVTLDTLSIKDVADSNTYTPYVKVAPSTTAVAATALPLQVVAAGSTIAYKASVAEGFNPADIVEIKATGSAGTPKLEANKKAVAADMDLLKAYFNDFYTITSYVDDNGDTFVTVSAKSFDNVAAADKDALVAKYGTLYKNFGGNAANVTRGSFFIAGNLLWTGGIVGTPTKIEPTSKTIEWTQAPLTKKYYNKKGTLAKTYSFTVKAAADAKVTYSLKNGGSMIKIDKNTGKITVKKGLKVGTYKVYVTASVKGTTETLSDSYVLTIQMAKKK